MKRKTNEQKLNALIKGLHTIEVALLVERLDKIMRMTKQDIEEEPEKYDNWFVSHQLYLSLAEKTIKSLELEN